MHYIKRVLFYFGFFCCVLQPLEAAITSQYYTKDFDQHPLRMTKGGSINEFITRRVVYTRLGRQIFHCVRDKRCYRVDPEHMLIYKNHFHVSKKGEKGASWYAMQDDHLKADKPIKRHRGYVNRFDVESVRKRHAGVPEIKHRFYNYQHQLSKGYLVNYEFVKP